LVKNFRIDELSIEMVQYLHDAKTQLNSSLKVYMGLLEIFENLWRLPRFCQ